MKQGIGREVAILARIRRRLAWFNNEPAPVQESEEIRTARALSEAGIFDSDFYRRAYPDVAASELSPINHFIEFGLQLARQPSLRFDPVAYADLNFDVGGAANAVLHYVYYGRREGRNLGVPPLDPARLDAVLQSIEEGGFFDAAHYRCANPVVETSGMDPVFHYLVNGHRTLAEPSPNFSTRAYVGLYADVRASGLNPLAHWLEFGRFEGRTLPDGKPSNFRWTDPAKPYALPDDIVHCELMAGKAYFAGQGFDFADRGTPDLIARSVECMAEREPRLSIGQNSPKVSIIVPVYGQTHFVLNCLDSLVQHVSKHSVEIIVADDASPEETRTALLARIPWIRYERRKSNGGFLECCNFAVNLSRGEFVVLLNSDTRVVPGWLDELVDGFELFPNAGLTGSKLFNDDGTLQEAGGIFWRDGSAHNYGRGDDPNRPQYCHARQADFISGASIAVRRRVWDELAGFDELYRPAYCEDADLAFRMRRAGYEVWYVPFSRVIHYEGVTHGRDTTRGVKAYQVENLKKFAERFASELHVHPQPGTNAARAASWRSARNILVVDALTPRPDKDSGSIVTNEVMRTYREMGFGESFVPLHNLYYFRSYSAPLQRRGVCCHYLPFSPDIRAVLEVSHAFDYALLYRYNVAQGVCAQLRELSPATRVIFANVDLHYLRESRAASANEDANGIFKAAVTKSHELAMFARADASFVHTEVEKKIIQAAMPRPLNNIVVLPWLSDILQDARAFSDRDDIMFLGNFPHDPNVDSIKFFMTSIWPALVKRLPPQAKLLVVGNKPPPEVVAMASERVVVTGYVEDLKPYFSSSRVFVAPLRYGAGIKGKLVMALAHGVPSIATTIAAEGIGTNESGYLCVADDPKVFADDVMRVYADEALWTQMRTAGWAFVQEHYSSAAAAALCSQALKVADETWLARQETKCRATLIEVMRENGELSESPTSLAT
ncbi:MULTISPECIES: glycosyltransferase [unclassified Variovorax]|uniref:glycosyltransferase n=1 Tax=unclassified Variovorax TaxID=663243 RepID=UPI003ECC273B